MTGAQTLSDPTGSKRALMAASLEFGTHPLVGQHLYRAGTIPVCGRCGRQRVLYGGVCGACGDIEAQEDGRG